jgi:hypothetical protein
VTTMTRRQTWEQFAKEEQKRLRSGESLWDADRAMTYLGIGREELRRLVNGRHPSFYLLPCHRKTKDGRPLFREQDLIWLLYQWRTEAAKA